MVVATSLRTGPSSTIGARPGPGWGVVGGGGRERPLRLASVLFNYSAGPLLRRGRKGCAHPGVGAGWGARRGEASAEPASQVPRGGAAQRRPQIGSRSGPSALPPPPPALPLPSPLHPSSLPPSPFQPSQPLQQHSAASISPLESRRLAPSLRSAPLPSSCMSNMNRNMEVQASSGRKDLVSGISEDFYKKSVEKSVGDWYWTEIEMLHLLQLER